MGQTLREWGGENRKTFSSGGGREKPNYWGGGGYEEGENYGITSIEIQREGGIAEIVGWKSRLKRMGGCAVIKRGGCLADSF